MRILAVDGSAKAASAAIIENGRIVAECYSDAGLTHSVTLMPMVDTVCRTANVSPTDIDCYAVTHGPGSFTGVRIAVSAVKGLSDATGKGCLGVSTLEAISWSLRGFNCVAACVMDARCSQVYTALFRICGNNVERLTEDEAKPIDELLEDLKQYEDVIYFVGDGAQLCFERSTLTNAVLAPPHLILQHAGCVGLLAENELKSRDLQPAGALTPVYLRLPQAERELNRRTLSENKR